MKIEIVKLNDWSGIYLDGEIFDQNHLVDYDNLLINLIGKKISYVVVYFINDEKLIEDNDKLPKQISDIPENILLV